MASVRPQARRRGTDVLFDVHDDNDDECSVNNEGDDASSQGDCRSDLEIDSAEESDDVPDEAVQDDIDKFNRTFKGISQRFRLINRIGEGGFIHLE
jgi:cell division control protein 7